MMTNEIILLDKVTKTFPKAKKTTVYETTLAVGEKCFVTILGASGSGKTTLLKMINRLYEPSSGTIYVNGKDTSQVPLNELRRGMGYVIQQVGLFYHMTIEQNIATIPEILGWEKPKIQERVNYLLELVGLSPDEYKDQYPRHLSGGQQQRVGLARAMAGDPPIMIMDEPFGTVDPIARIELQDKILEIQRKLNKTILFVTNDLKEAFKLGDRVIIMNEGRVQQYDTPINLVLNPANDIVKRLVNADNVFQKLSLTPVRSLMIPVEPKDVQFNRDIFIYEDMSLHEALGIFLCRNMETILVKDRQGESVGSLSFGSLTAFTRSMSY